MTRFAYSYEVFMFIFVDFKFLKDKISPFTN